ncbi:hypothetical protein H4R33_002203 [Dimargaris cristalligena]|uniref:Kinase n=1 Tax=Dimargaris cristalligena TaxID=215637 RepID=A0A4P9ZNA0_9FUNG|nr:hypothetical protein H4R33_002203 [Dimargaris cristalligena]RKP33790.1 hypothetical protein BJ085DRAFT_34354 [Dimargaris cristalligena]|eukprot:RKP33790.1 hypothetical protein BJ085DRAFT_34354 [Dimargaris cristalligena]
MTTPTTQPTRSILTADELVNLPLQIAGHPGIVVTRDGQWIVKATNQVERAFYEAAYQNPHHADSALVRNYLAKFSGTVLFHSPQTTATQPEAAVQVSGQGQAKPVEGIQLANQYYTLVEPIILDVKIGTHLYEASAPHEKKIRTRSTYGHTPSFRYGVRIVGFHIPDASNPLGAALTVDRVRLRAITTEDMPTWIAKFVSATRLGEDYASALLEWLQEDFAGLDQALGEVDGANLYAIGASTLVVYEGNVERAVPLFKQWQIAFTAGRVEDARRIRDQLFRFTLIDFGHSYWKANPTVLNGMRLGLSNLVQIVKSIRTGQPMEWQEGAEDDVDKTALV